MSWNRVARRVESGVTRQCPGGALTPRGRTRRYQLHVGNSLARLASTREGASVAAAREDEHAGYLQARRVVCGRRPGFPRSAGQEVREDAGGGTEQEGGAAS